jgi:2,3-diketo-5-methylthio-1-phosphopentane phosphatase
MRVVCDFDGTITLADTTDVVLANLARPHWRKLEDRWMTREISAAECKRRQIALIGPDRAALDAVLDRVEIDPAFARFVAWCREQSIQVSIVSDGVDYFIARILARHGLGDIPAVANELVERPSRMSLAQPWIREGCAGGSGVCKCSVAVIETLTEDAIVYVGDGRSDFCVSHRADVLFAKGALADYAAARGQTFHPFNTFDDVAAVVARLHQAETAAARQAV